MKLRSSCRKVEKYTDIYVLIVHILQEGRVLIQLINYLCTKSAVTNVAAHAEVGAHPKVANSLIVYKIIMFKLIYLRSDWVLNPIQ